MDGGAIRLAAGEGVIVASDDAGFELPAGSAVEYAGAGKITVLENHVGATISAGACLANSPRAPWRFLTGPRTSTAATPDLSSGPSPALEFRSMPKSQEGWLGASSSWSLRRPIYR